ncbi:MAG: hypothetical protein JWO35_889 [Candidatus Saccharibacteria bacterium]|nr:hypothetical protein [Candidatus Saccharibacteria bacterium]
MKIKKLDVRGFSHDILMVAFVVIFAVVGVGYVVASHADSCTSSSTKNCASVSMPVTSARLSSKVKCSISGVTKSPKFGDQVNPILTVTNIGKVPTSVSGDEHLGAYNSAGKKIVIKGGPVSSLKLGPGESFTMAMPPYTVQYATKDAVKGVYAASSKQTPKYACSAIFNLPRTPAAKS